MSGLNYSPVFDPHYQGENCASAAMGNAFFCISSAINIISPSDDKHIQNDKVNYKMMTDNASKCVQFSWSGSRIYP